MNMCLPASYLRMPGGRCVSGDHHKRQQPEYPPRIETARKSKVGVIGLTGESGARCVRLATFVCAFLQIDGANSGNAHHDGHAICELLEDRLGKA